MKSQIPNRSTSIGKEAELFPLIRPHQIAGHLIKGEYLKAAVLRNWELSSKQKC